MKYTADPAETDRLRELARECAAQVSRVTGAQNVSQNARDAARDYEASINEVLDEDTHLRSLLAELDQKAQMLGLSTEVVYGMRQRIVNDHKQRASEADRRAAAALDTLKTQLRQDAVPKVNADPAQVSLARQELSVAVGNATGEALVGSLMSLADQGNSDVLGVLLSSTFGDTLLRARGIDGKRADEAMADLRTVAANAAAARGDSEAAALVGIEDELVAARTAAMSTLASTADEAVGVDHGAAR